MAKVTKSGTVIKRIDQRTVSVKTVRMKIHPLYKKRFKVVKKILADDPTSISQVGDIVTIEECRPLSKTKHFKVIEKIGSTNMIDSDKIVGEEVLGAERKNQESIETEEQENTDADSE